MLVVGSTVDQGYGDWLLPYLAHKVGNDVLAAALAFDPLARGAV